MAEQRKVDPQTWLAEFRAYQAARAEHTFAGETPPVGIQAYIARAYAHSQQLAHQREGRETSALGRDGHDKETHGYTR